MNQSSIGFVSSIRWLPTVAAIFLAACSGGNGGSSTSAPPPPPPPPSGIGAAGGTVTGPNGSAIVVPANALTQSTALAIAASSQGAPALPANTVAAGEIYAFTPHGTAFATPATVTVPFDAARVPAGRSVGLRKTNAAQNGWEAVVGATVVGTAMTAPTSSLSWWLVILVLPLLCPLLPAPASGLALLHLQPRWPPFPDPMPGFAHPSINRTGPVSPGRRARRGRSPAQSLHWSRATGLTGSPKAACTSYPPSPALGCSLSRPASMTCAPRGPFRGFLFLLLARQERTRYLAAHTSGSRHPNNHEGTTPMARKDRLLPFVCLTMLIGTPAVGAVVDDDLSFAGTGTAIKGATNQDFSAGAIQPLPGGNVLVAGTYVSDNSNNNVAEAVVFAFGANGSPDAGFGTNGLAVVALPNRTTAATAWGLARSSATGDLYVSGYELAGPTRLFLARLNAQGQTLGTAFPQSGDPLTHTLNGYPRGLHVLPNGKVLAVDIATSGGTPWVLLARFNADGSVDTSFGGGDGVLLWRPVEPGTAPLQLRLFGTARDGAGRVLLMLTANNANGSDRLVLVARLDADGMPDPAFRTGGALPLTRPTALGSLNLSTDRRATFGVEPTSDKVFVGLESGTDGRTFLLKLNADGSQDPAYGSGGASSGVSAAIQQHCGATFAADGSVILAGNTNLAGTPLWRFAGWNANGMPLNTDGFSNGVKVGAVQFPNTNIFATCSADLRLDDQGRVLLAGYWDRVDLSPRRSEALVARFAAADARPPPQPGQLRFETATPPGVSEGVGIVTLRLVREGGTDGTVTVEFRLVAETAVVGADFGTPTPANGTLTFANGVTAQSIVIPIVDDNVFEPGPAETFRVELFNATGGATLGAPSATTIQIVDNDSGFDLALSMDPPTFFSDGVMYRVVVTNQSADPSPARTVQIEAPPDPLDFLSADSILRPGGTRYGSYQPGVDRWSVPSLLFNQSAELRWTARFTIPADAGGFITFRARVLDNTDDINPSNDATELALPVGDDLAVNVTSPETSYAAGANVPFDVQVIRIPIPTPTGSRYASAVLTLDLASDNDGTTNSNTRFSPERTVGATCTAENDSKRLVCNLGDLSPPRVLPIVVRVEGTGTDDRTLRLTASLATTTFDPDLANNMAMIGVTIRKGLIGAPLRNFRDLRACGDGECNDCFIATAAYGSWLDPHVVTLREFRDRWLLTHPPGRAFVAWYYRLSPPAANWIAERDWARAVVRTALAPVVLVVRAPIESSLALLVITLAASMVVRVRRTAIAGAAGTSAVAVLVALMPADAAPTLAQAGATGATPPPPVGSDTDCDATHADAGCPHDWQSLGHCSAVANTAAAQGGRL